MEIEEDTAVIPSEEAQSYAGSWISPIMRYLQYGEIPMGENPRAFRIKSFPDQGISIYNLK
uniref:Uncharacterized protein n=1 Tax=Helianthus annuus TaxID=4232 RepID=A0A251TVH4_HELAN